MVSDILVKDYYNIVGLLLLIPLLLVFLLAMIDVKRLKLLFGVYVSNRYFYTYPLERATNFSLFYLLIYGFVATVYGLVLMLFLYPKELIFENLLTLFAKTFLYSILYVGFKYVVSEFSGYFLRVKKSSKQMLILETSYLVPVMLVLYGVVSYAFLHLHKLETTTNILLFSGLILYVIRCIALVNNNKNLLSIKLFYIILYLCTLEIFPIIYLFKGYIQ